jgi:hypothetical protein
MRPISAGDRGQQQTTEEETHPLEGILGTREDRHPLKQLAFPLAVILRGFGHHGLDGALGAHLVEILRDATDRLGHHDIGHTPPFWPGISYRHQHQ